MVRRARKRKADEEVGQNEEGITDKENVDTQMLIQGSPPKKQRTTAEQENFGLAMQLLDIEVEERKEDMHQHLEIMVSSIKNKFATQLRKLPRKIREMSMAQFAVQYSGQVDGVMAESHATAKKELASFMRNTYTPAVQARTTRASARKAAAEQVALAQATPARGRLVRASAMKVKPSTKKRGLRTANKYATPARSQTLPVPASTARRVTRSMRKSHSGMVGASDRPLETMVGDVGARVDHLLDQLLA